MIDGLEQMQNKRQERAQRGGRRVPPPRRPVSTAEGAPALRVVIDEAVADEAKPLVGVTGDGDAGAERGGVATAPLGDPEPGAAPSPEPGDSEAGRGRHQDVIETVAASVASPQASVASASAKPEPAAGSRSGKAGAAKRALPDLTIDWTDPLMHVVKPNRVAVDVSVEARFRVAANSPSGPSNTEIVMSALTKHLVALPELVLARRPEEQGAAEGFFVRRAPLSRPEQAVSVHVRPKVGEWEALGRIEEWVTGVITAGHPGRRKASKSEIITAALAVEYPAAAI
jgi:hypothetical protein